MNAVLEPPSLRPCFVPGVRLAGRDGDRLTFALRDGQTLDLRVRTTSMADAIVALTEGRSTEDDLATVAERDGGYADNARFRYFLALFRKRLLIRYRWGAGDGVDASVYPTTPDFEFSREPYPAHAAVFSRFAYARREGDHVVLECADARARIVCETPAAAGWFAAIAGGEPAPDERLQAAAALLWTCGFLEPGGAAETDARAAWEFHDRLFHTRSRRGFSDRPMGGTYRFVGARAPWPAIKPAMSAERIPLPVPGGGRESESLASVMERRRSVYDVDDDRPMPLADLGALLYRVMRVRETQATPRHEVVFKPVPAGGAIHELECYVACRLCDGLAAGLYHYQCAEHALYRLPAPGSDVAALVQKSGISMGGPEKRPQLLLVLASRVPRLAWKYEGLAYRTTLLNAGIILEAFYLVATELNLACSAIGSGDAGLFAHLTGLDSFAETSVAEFALGSRR